MISPDLKISAAGQDKLYGKPASDLVEEGGKILKDGTVLATLKHVTEYEGFSNNPSEQDGWYLPAELITSGETMTFRKSGSAPKEDIPFEVYNVFRIPDTSTTIEILVDKKAIITLKFNRAVLKP